VTDKATTELIRKLRFEADYEQARLDGWLSRDQRRRGSHHEIYWHELVRDRG